MKNEKSSQTGSEVVKFWDFLEFSLKNGKFLQPGFKEVEFWNFYLKTVNFSTRVLGSEMLGYFGIFTEKRNFFHPGFEVVEF